MSRIAMVSTAHIHTDGFLTALTKEIEGASCVAIWDDVAERGRMYADKYNVPFVADLDAVLNDGSIDGFVICAENTRHLPLLEKVLPIRKTTFCEKPLATTAADAQRIAALQKQHGTALMSGYFQPFFAHHQAVRAMMRDNAFGKVTHARFTNAHHAAYGRWFDSPALQWFTDPALSGGGALMDMGTHALHLLLHLCGPAKRVWAQTHNVTGQYPTVDDDGMILIDFENGIKGRVEASWSFTGNLSGLQIIGSQKSCVQNQALEIHQPGQPPATLPNADARPDRMRRLVAAIRNQLSKEELADDLQQCLRAVVTMDAAYASAKSGQWVNVPTIG